MSEDRRMEAEQRYIAGDETLAEISKSTGIPLNSLKRWSKAGDWVKKREKLKKRALRKAATRAADRKARELSRLLEASDELEKALLTSAKAIVEIAEKEPNDFALTQSETMLNYSKSLEKLASTRSMTGGAMSAADRERLDLLKRKTDMEERREAKDKELADGVRIVIGPDEEAEAFAE